MEEETIEGYHGTKSENIELICTGNFNINEDIINKLYLGSGIYFFVELSDALDWNIKEYIKEHKCIPSYEKITKEYGIIKSIIVVSKCEILDLDKKDILRKFELLISRCNGKLVTKEQYKKASNKTTAIINMMYKRGEIKRKILMKTFFEPIGTKHLHGLKNYPRKMICVKSNDLIKEKTKINEISKEDYDSIIYFL